MFEEINKQAIELFLEIIREEKIQEYLKILKNHHEETCQHCLRVCLWCLEIGFLEKFEKKEIKKLGYAGILHDLGKLYVSKDILSSEKTLNEKEKAEIREHTRKGFEKLKELGHEELAKIIIAHHEFQEDSYPRKKEKKIENDRRQENSGKEIAQILAVADNYDSLKNKRSYKKPLEEKKAIEILEKNFTGNKKYLNLIKSKNI